MRTFIDQIPRELDEAAMIDGASQFQIIRRVIFPLAAQGMLAVAVFVIVYAWNEFLFAFIFTTTRAKTAPLVVAEMIGAVEGVEWGVLFAASAVQLLPVLAFVILMQKHLVAGPHGRRGERIGHDPDSTTCAAPSAKPTRSSAASIRLPRIICLDDFDRGMCGWTQLVGNYEHHARPDAARLRPAHPRPALDPAELGFRLAWRRRRLLCAEAGDAGRSAARRTSRSSA